MTYHHILRRPASRIGVLSGYRAECLHYWLLAMNPLTLYRNLQPSNCPRFLVKRLPITSASSLFCALRLMIMSSTGMQRMKYSFLVTTIRRVTESIVSSSSSPSRSTILTLSTSLSASISATIDANSSSVISAYVEYFRALNFFYAIFKG